MSIAAGTKLGRYEIRSKIGAGGMGEVYLAQDPTLGRNVALKVLPEDVASNQQRMQRFVQKAQAASALNHPNIITIYEIGTVTPSFCGTRSPVASAGADESLSCCCFRNRSFNLTKDWFPAGVKAAMLARGRMRPGVN